GATCTGNAEPGDCDAERIPHLLHERHRILRAERERRLRGRGFRRLGHEGVLWDVYATGALISCAMTNGHATLLAELDGCVGPSNVLRATVDVEPYLVD